MLGVGIHDDVYLSSVLLDDKDTIHITFKEAAKAGKTKKSHFEMAASSEAEEVENGTNVMLFPGLPPQDKPDKPLTEEKKLDRIVGDINKTKAQCLHLLKGYLPSDQLVGKLEPFAGLALTEQNFSTEIMKKEVLAKVQRNIGTTFINLIKPFLDKPELKFRLLLVRQSSDKHFATLRGKYLDDQPFWESMDVPKEASKVKFTDWEKANGFDSGVPLPKAGKDSAASGSAAAPVTAANIFNQ